MARLLPTRLPLASNEVTPELYNRLVRVLELNLGQFDPNRTPQFTDSEISELNFVAGDIIYNAIYYVVFLAISLLVIKMLNKKQISFIPTSGNSGTI